MPKSTLTAAQDRFWYGYASRLPVTLEITRLGDVVDMPQIIERSVRELVAESFAAGARWNLRETSRLSPYVNQFLHMCVLLGVLDDDEQSAAVMGNPTGGDTTTNGNASDQTEPPY